MATMTTVGDFITETQELAQDRGAIRFSQDRYYTALNLALSQAARLRPDFFRDTFGISATYTPADVGAALVWPDEYKWPLLAFMVGHVTLTDDEGGNDGRVVALMNAFTMQLKSNRG